MTSKHQRHTTNSIPSPNGFYPNLPMQQFPKDYKPVALDIVCGRGKRFTNHEGNSLFAATIRANLQRYTDAKSRIDKSIVVASLVYSLQETGARFLKFDAINQTWSKLGDQQAREKTGHAIRDLLSNSGRTWSCYKSRKKDDGNDMRCNTICRLGEVEKNNAIAYPQSSAELEQIDIPSGQPFDRKLGEEDMKSICETPAKNGQRINKIDHFNDVLDEQIFQIGVQQQPNNIRERGETEVAISMNSLNTCGIFTNNNVGSNVQADLNTNQSSVDISGLLRMPSFCEAADMVKNMGSIPTAPTENKAFVDQLSNHTGDEEGGTATIQNYDLLPPDWF